MTEQLLVKYEQLTKDLLDDPYNPSLYVQRSEVYKELGYPDLCAGDAYKALLLVDEAEDESEEFHEPAISALRSIVCVGQPGSLEAAKNSLLVKVYEVLVESLTRCGCLKVARDFRLRASQRLPEHFLGQRSAQAHWAPSELLEGKSESLEDPKLDPSDFSERGFVRREVYPWNHYEPDRYNEDYIRSLNHQLGETTSACHVKTVELPFLNGEAANQQQLGMFALRDLLPGETILEETSILTAIIEPEDARCDTCAVELPQLSENKTTFACEDCDDTVFCSKRCLEAAQKLYHPAVCGTNISSLAEHIEPKETADALYFLLLSRAFAMAETQDTHPLKLKEVQSLWGEFETLPSMSRAARTTLPFSFKFNILFPLHALQQMGLDIYASTARYDFWVINTLYAKFRGVASAKSNPRTGRPEVCAVHPLWCLANHSCSPNVRWEWSGAMKLWVRKDDEAVRWGENTETGQYGRKAGVRAGEEILNHYCDVDLPVHERREWMEGPLGGNCVCERCMWEAAEVVETRC